MTSLSEYGYDRSLVFTLILCSQLALLVILLPRCGAFKTIKYLLLHCLVFDISLVGFIVGMWFWAVTLRFFLGALHAFLTPRVAGSNHMTRWLMGLTPAAPLTEQQRKSLHMPTNPNFEASSEPVDMELVANIDLLTPKDEGRFTSISRKLARRAAYY